MTIDPFLITFASSLPGRLGTAQPRQATRSMFVIHAFCLNMLPLIILCLFGQCSITRAQTASAGPATSSSRIVEASQATVLTTESPIERELKGGEAHSFRVNLTPGQFLQVIVEQKGIDVVVTLFGPDGKQITRMDSPNDNQGPEPIVVVAEHSGDYGLEVRSRNSKASTGRYEIRIVAQRAATPKDNEHVAAERSFAEGQRLRSQRTAPARREAIESFEAALPYFESTGERHRQALTLFAIAFAHAESSEFREALKQLSRILPLARSLDNPSLEGDTLNFMGGAYDLLGEVDRALDYYSQGLDLFRKTGNRSSEAYALNNLGKIYYDLADWQKAMDYFNQALPLARAFGDQRREAVLLHNLGSILNSTGEPERALPLFQQSLLLRRAVGDKAGEAGELNAIGTAERLMGRLQESLDYYNQALTLRRAVGDRRLEASTLDDMGTAYAALGQTEKALEAHQQALQLQRAVENPRGQAVSLGNIAYVYARQRQLPTAIESYAQALSIFRTLNDSNNGAAMLQGIARAERDRGNLTEARSRLEEALRMFEEVRARAGGQQVRASYFASKLDAYKLYIDLLMQEHRLKPTEGHDAEALAASERARARSLIELLNEAHVDIRQGVDAGLIERERTLAQLLNAKAQRQIQLLGQKSSQVQLAELIKEIRTLEDEYQQVQSAIRKASPAYAALTQPQPLSLKEIQEQLDPNTVLLEYSLGEGRSYVWAITQTALSSYELPKREQLEKAARQFYELLTTRSLFKPGEGAAQRQERIAEADAQLVEAGKELSQMVLGPVAAGLGNKRLVVVSDGALQYVPFAALSVVSGQLSVINGPTTRGEQRTTDKGQRTTAAYKPLIIDHEIISLPSASALAVQRKSLAGRKPAANAVAVIADPVFSIADQRFRAHARASAARSEQADSAANSAADSTNATRIIEHLADDSDGNAASKLVIRRLRFTRQEAEQILAVAPRRSNLKALDFKASRATATSADLGQYRYVHFATHGYLDSERPDLSAMVLSLVDEQGKPQDGFLRAHEIYNLNLPAELVVLSACQTGLGKEIKGEGLVGLTRGFMYAGARRVVVSLWNVNDKATAELMQRFYRGMLNENQTPAASLRKAQAEMSKIKQWQSPYYWAAFQLQGEWK